MFFKITKGKREEYLYLIKGYRDTNGKVKHEKLVSFGRLKDLEPTFIKSLAQVVGHNPNFELVQVNGLRVEQKVNWGGHSIVNHFWQYFELGSWTREVKANSKIKIDIEAILKLLIVNRLLAPQSKLQIYQKQRYYGGQKEVELHKLYRSLDFLYEYQEELQKHFYEQQLVKEKMQVNVVFYDVTTFYFESVKKDELRDFGFSKDCKVNQTQVMFSILINHEGRPLRCDIHKGNSYEGHTLIKALERVSKEYKIKKVVLVADRGINNGINLLKIKEAGYDYIVGSRIKNASKAIKQEILDLKRYDTMICDSDGKLSLAYKLLDREKRVKDEENKTQIISNRLICTWSGKRAAKDKADRERLVNRAYEMVENNRVIAGTGAKKYIDVRLRDAPKLKVDKIAEDLLWDGFYAIETSDLSLSSREVAEAYHQLWVVEDSFRIFKHYFETRPMFHWTPKRIIGHLILSYMAFVFEKTLELNLKKLKEKQKETKQEEVDISHERIREALRSMEVSIIDADNKKIQVCSKHNELADMILLTFKLDRPMNCKI